MRYERIPTNLRGRVSSLTTASARPVMPLRALAAGMLTEWFGLLPGIGWLHITITFSLALIPSMREINRPASPVFEPASD